MWRTDKRKFLKIASDTGLCLFVRQFEFEDGERGDVARQMRRRE